MSLLLIIAVVLVLAAVLGGLLIEPLLWLILIGAVIAVVLSITRRGTA
jgi:hypothetical protein